MWGHLAARCPQPKGIGTCPRNTPSCESRGRMELERSIRPFYEAVNDGEENIGKGEPFH